MGLTCHRFGDDELRVLEAELSAGGVPALLSTRSAARRLLRARVADAFPALGLVAEAFPAPAASARGGGAWRRSRRRSWRA
ncbi:hypothetical protein ACP70R_041020 [Stipagrostis hirtigluma subsp. patula]